jgi:hypothetical protein
MINRKFIGLASLTVLILALAYFVFIFEFHPSGWPLSPAIKPAATPITDKSINFNHIGNFHMSDPKLKSNEFYLIYETPSAPALSVRLYFNNKTICQDYSGEASCPQPVFGDGAKIQILGTKVNNYVVVKKVIIP